MSDLRVYDPNYPAGSPKLNAAAIVLCRLDSSRLPGKVLRPINNRPLLHWVVDRVSSIQNFAHPPIVATSSRPVDDPIAAYCDFHHVTCFRGEANDVSRRILDCAEAFDLDWFSRINGDSPLVDCEVIDQACEIAASDNIDFVTNLVPRTFPYGVSVELVRVALFRKMYRKMTSADHFEHVTKILYEPEFQVRTHAITNSTDMSSHRLTIDNQQDWIEYRRCISESNRSPAEISFQEAIRILQPVREAA